MKRSEVYLDGDRGGLVCNNCGAFQELAGSMPLPEFVKAAEEFSKKHSHKKEPKK